MKILMIAPEPCFTPRGTPLSILGRLRALSDQGHQVDLLTYPMGENIRLDGLTIHRVRYLPGMRKVRVGPSVPKIFYDLLLFMKAFSLLRKNRYDLIHAHEEAAMFSVFFSRLFDTPLLYDMHSNLPEQMENFKVCNFRIIRAVFRAFQRLTVNRSILVITICPWLFDFIRRLYPEKPCGLVENMLDGTFLFGLKPSESPAQIRRRLGLLDKPVAVHVGTLEAYQGLELLLRSAVRLKEQGLETIFVVVGGEAAQIAAGRAQAEKLGVEHLFRITGKLMPWEVPAYIEMADILVSARVSGTNTPSKVYGYLRSGKPIVATNLLTHTQVLTPEVSMLVEKTPEAFAEGIRKVLTDRELSARITRNAVLLAEGRYSERRYFETMEQIMMEVEEHVRDLRSGPAWDRADGAKARSERNVPTSGAPRA